MQLKTSIYCQTIHTIYPYMSEPIQNYLNPFRTTGTGTWFRHMFKIKELCGKFSSRHLFPAEKKLCYEKKNFLLVYSVKERTYKDPVRIRPEHLVIRSYFFSHITKTLT